MLTPRRTMLLLAGFVLFAGAYSTYAQLLGWLDGLPQLPAKMLLKANGSFAPPERPVSPTHQKIVEAFGDKSPETNYSHYETQIEFRSGDSSIVVAAGKPPSNPKSPRVTLTPFSVAVFSKPKPAHLRQPGEVTEISTIHADRGILEFDREITNPAEMKKAKLIGIELVSDFEQALPDPRRGVVHITNNQRSADPNQFLILRTVGPVFYRDATAVAGTPAAQGPDLWTDAPVEIVDRQNLPRPIGSAAPITAPAKSEENRNPGAIAAILSGQRTPPPTVTAIGLRVYLEPDPPPGQKKKAPKAGTTANPLSGVRRVEFLEQVVMNLWVDNGQSIVGGAPPEPGAAGTSKSNALAFVPPPAAIVAVTGGLGPAAYNVRLMNRAMLQIDTRGPFAYDAEKSLARFDVVPHSDPNLPNDVQVTKIPAQGGTSSLFSQVLEIEFNGGPTAGARPANAPAIKRLHAWTSTPGRYVTLASQDDATEAYGHDFVHEHAANRTILTGSPLYLVRERNVLSAGTAQVPATFTSEPGPLPPPTPPGTPPARRPQIATVRGAGRVELFDPASNAVTIGASWKTSLVQSKEIINGREQDLFVLTDDAKFEDLKADYWLKGTVLKMWLEPRAAQPTPADAKTASGPAKPSRVESIGQVRSHSTDYDIDDADYLTVHFRDPKLAPTVVAIAPPKLPVSPGVVAVAPPLPGPMSPVGPMPLPPVGPMALVPPKPPEAIAKAPEKPKPPYHIRAKVIETFVTRGPVAPTAPAKPGDPPASVGTKYQLDHARCEDNVTVHQDPVDSTKPRGVDILGRLLLIDASADGSVMTVYGWPERPGEVHQEEMSLLGPKVVLNQVLNSSSVDGRGALTMPTRSDLAGTELAKPETVVIHWHESMAFNGAQKSAVFVGKVSARQGESWVLCHTMNVVFDRPVYFNQAQKRAAAPMVATNPKDPNAKPSDTAKIDKVFCYPAPADDADENTELFVTYNEVENDKTGKLVKVQQLRAQELKMEAQAQDPTGGEKYQRVVAEGPGTLRIWQQGDANPTGPAPGSAPTRPMAPGAQPPAKDEQEMKLTVIEFNSRMIGIDKGKVFQQATFVEKVEVISVPSDSPSLKLEKHKLPPRAVFLRCDKELVVWSHKGGDVPPVQRMDATGNAYVRTDEYDGSGQTISSKGKLVTLTGSEAVPARIMSRFGQGNEQSGQKIIYDRGLGKYSVKEGFGGSISPAPKAPPPSGPPLVPPNLNPPKKKDQPEGMGMPFGPTTSGTFPPRK